ncbi:MAG: hypothetical protein M1830_002222 [Pleopsidium flavum]|nr:MAG: hypothetical protein M1830_002222 [Pleopsidium flavum]
MPSKTVHVPHLGGIEAGYEMPYPYDPEKPTCILVNSFTTTTDLYRDQYQNKDLNDTMNLLAIEPLGHGKTRTKSEHFTFWDTAIMSIQVLDALGIKKAFALGTSQGGFIVVRMALLAPDKIEGIIPLGTSMDYESEHSRQIGCWNAYENCVPLIERWSSTQPTPDWVVDDEFCDLISMLGFGRDCPESTKSFWKKTQKEIYRGDEGRKRIRMAAINLLERDGLHSRLQDVTCPVLWLHGSNDIPFDVRLPKEEIKMFVNAADAKLHIVEGGAHYLSATHPKEVNQALIDFVTKFRGNKL